MRGNSEQIDPIPQQNDGDDDKENLGLIASKDGKTQVSGHELLLYQIDNQKIKLTDTLKLYILGLQNQGKNQIIERTGFERLLQAMPS